MLCVLLLGVLADVDLNIIIAFARMREHLKVSLIPYTT